MENVKNLEMTDDKKKLIYSMLLNIKDSVTKVTDSYDIENPNWQEILKVLDESEAEMVYILENAKNETKKY